MCAEDGCRRRAGAGGFRLVEVLVAMSIVALVTPFLFAGLISSLTHARQAQNRGATTAWAQAEIEFLRTQCFQRLTPGVRKLTPRRAAGRGTGLAGWVRRRIRPAGVGGAGEPGGQRQPARARLAGPGSTGCFVLHYHHVYRRPPGGGSRPVTTPVPAPVRRDRGTTLIEVLTALAIASIVTTSLHLLVGSAIKARLIVNARVADQEQGRLALAFLADRLRQVNYDPRAACPQGVLRIGSGNGFSQRLAFRAVQIGRASCRERV